MSNKPFIYCAPFPMGKDNTEYYLLTSDYVSVADFDGETILKVEPEALTLLAQRSLSRCFFHAPPGTPETGCGYSSRSRSQRKRQVRGAAILKKLEIAAKACCRPAGDTGTAIIVGKKVSACGPVAVMKHCRKVSITPISKITCAIHRTRRWTCIKRSTPARTCLRKSTCMR